MKLSLEELRAQRELILRQLRWIEGKIAGLEEAPKAPAAADGNATPENSESKPAQATKSVADFPIPGESVLRVKTASQVKQAQIGCFLIFVGACALFLFLLFGLPYLIDSDDAPETKPPTLPEEWPDTETSGPSAFQP